MPWRECSVIEERLRFVARLLDGAGMSDVCREQERAGQTLQQILQGNSWTLSNSSSL